MELDETITATTVEVSPSQAWTAIAAEINTIVNNTIK
jgi:hypothetical protein